MMTGFFFNYKDGAKTLTLDELGKSSDLLHSAPPNKYWMNTYFFSGGFAVKCVL